MPWLILSPLRDWCWLRKLCGHLILAGAVTLLWMLPDHFYHWLNPGYRVALEERTITGFYLLSILLLAVKLRPAVLLTVTFFALLQVTQLFHFAYFGTHLSPHEIGMLVGDFQENGAEVAVGLWRLTAYLITPLAAVGAGTVALILLAQYVRPYCLQTAAALPVLILLLASLPVSAYASKGDSQRFYPNPTSYSIKNTYFALSYFLGRDLPRLLRGSDDAAPNAFLPYRVSRHGDITPRNVVIVMGESLGYRHMGLFGYSRETTPHLNMLKDDPDFIYRPAIAASVTTRVSLPTFFNVLREPGNTAHLIRADANLFRMAKAQGLATYFISTQNASLATYGDRGSVDHFITREDMAALVAQHYDEALLLQLQQIDLGHPSFIVLHQRNSHFPYDRNYPPRFGRYPTKDVDFAEYMLNAYDNSVLFTDDLLTRIIAYLQTHSPLPTYLYFTSDHAEMLGENGLYGHNQLQWSVSQVPFLFYAIHGDPRLQGAARALNEPTHYEVGKLIAATLGLAIDNPNERDSVYYINGNDITGAAGFLTVQHTKATIAPVVGLAEPH